MKDNTYLIPKNGACPICSAMLIHIPPYYNCNDCQSVFKFLGHLQSGGDHDVLVQKLNAKEDGADETVQ